MSKNHLGQKQDDVFLSLKAITADLATIKTELADVKAKYDDHRHSVAGGAGVGTKPSTAGAAAEATASTVAAITAKTMTSD